MVRKHEFTDNPLGPMESARCSSTEGLSTTITEESGHYKGEMIAHVPACGDWYISGHVACHRLAAVHDERIWILYISLMTRSDGG